MVQTRRRVNRETLLIDALERQLVGKRLSEVGVEEIAAAAGITRTRFYFYFESKYDALASALRRIADELVDGIYCQPGSWWMRPAEASPRAAMTASFLAIQKLWEKHGPLLREASDLWNAVPQVRETWESIVSRLNERTAQQIERERSRGIAPAGPPARDLAKALMWQAERLFFLSLIDSRQAFPDDSLIEILLTQWLRTIYVADDPHLPLA
jgi:AcrR family transcriptional regulator